MKRSTAILLGATGVVLVGAWLGREPKREPEADALVFASVAECLNAGALSREACENEFAAARESHQSTAPRFTSANECESQYGSGSCQPATIAGTSYFIPAMAGALIASQLINQRRAQALLPPLTSAGATCPPGQTPQTVPGCVMRSTSGSGRSFSTVSGYSFNRTSSASPAIRVPSDVATRPAPRTSVGPVTPRSSTSSTTVSRGGFGSTAATTSSSSSS
jgi:uncharacterized protein YgiB involved in biofilm formation